MNAKAKILPVFLLTAMTRLFVHAETTDSIATSVTDLEELVVVSEKPIVYSDGAKLSYSLQEDISVKGQCLSDALRKVPMVSVDGEGKIRINGQDNFKIYVNGKEDAALTANYKDIFKAMPADAVIRVEVLTEPGAKYDAEGTAGILNLVTVTKNSTDGYSGNLNLAFSKSQASGSAFGRWKRGRLAMSANINYANARIFHQSNWNENFIENLNSYDARYQYNLIQQRVKWDYFGGGINMSYDLTDRDFVTMNANVTTMNGNLTKGGKSVYSVWDENHTLKGKLTRDILGQVTERSLMAGVAWEHAFSNNGEKMVLSYLYNYGENSLDATLTQTEAEGMYLEAPYEMTSNARHNNEHTLQLDYERPLADNKHTFEAGGKAVIRRNPAKSFTLRGTDSDNATLSPEDDSDITQRQDIYAAYALFNGKFGKLSANAGLRYEHTVMGIDFHDGDCADFTNHLNDVVPNAALAYIFSPASNIRLAYQMRISRPSLSQVNPYRFVYIPTIVETGNPDLESERANKITLTYSNFGRCVGGNIGMEFSTIDNAISSYIYESEGVIVSSYANIGHRKAVAVFGFLNWTPLQGIQVSVNARLTRQMFSSRMSDLSNSGWNLNYGANVNYSLPCKLRISLYGGQRTRSYNLQGWSNGWYYYGFGISRGFLAKNALTVSVTASNFLQSHMSNKSFTSTENIRNTFTFYNRNWNVGISLAWKFGSLKSDVRKTTKQIDNDDRSSVSGNNGMM